MINRTALPHSSTAVSPGVRGGWAHEGRPGPPGPKPGNTGRGDTDSDRAQPAVSKPAAQPPRAGPGHRPLGQRRRAMQPDERTRRDRFGSAATRAGRGSYQRQRPHSRARRDNSAQGRRMTNALHGSNALQDGQSQQSNRGKQRANMEPSS